jgi:LmbE family N-acetylglucosaminyl deacetylase
MGKRFKVSRRTAFLAIVLIVALCVVFVILNALRPYPFEVPMMTRLELVPGDRILVLAPHPDDEVLGCGGIIQRAKSMNLPVHVVFLTYGDFNEWSFMIYRKIPPLSASAVQGMGMVRHNEAITADATLGLAPEDLTFLGYPDIGTLSILQSHWGSSRPYRSLLTRVDAVPYADAFNPGAPYKGESILADLEKVITDFQPTKIFVSHPADHHPDHESLYLYTHVALWDLKLDHPPEIFPYLVHFRKWPRPRGFHPDRELMPPPNALLNIPWVSFPLDAAEVERDGMALKQHRTQVESDATDLISLIRSNELFGDFPPLSLPSSIFSSQLTDTSGMTPPEEPEQLSDKERASFLGFEERTVQIRDGNLELNVSLSRAFGRDVGVSVYVYGYRTDKPFADMPKLHIKFGAVQHTIFDQDRRLPPDSISVTRLPRQITMKIPLALLGDPDRILTGARSYLGDVPLDYLSWRELDLIK